ncbi:hypothetical protein C8J56DRAFT_935962 [Mycena floridula]|nr:hypothetical protein C8J56DRAFT_935962 [Mycena floridula]
MASKVHRQPTASCSYQPPNVHSSRPPKLHQAELKLASKTPNLANTNAVSSTVRSSKTSVSAAESLNCDKPTGCGDVYIDRFGRQHALFSEPFALDTPSEPSCCTKLSSERLKLLRGVDTCRTKARIHEVEPGRITEVELISRSYRHPSEDDEEDDDDDDDEEEGLQTPTIVTKLPKSLVRSSPRPPLPREKFESYDDCASDHSSLFSHPSTGRQPVAKLPPKPMSRKTRRTSPDPPLQVPALDSDTSSRSESDSASSSGWEYAGDPDAWASPSVESHDETWNYTEQKDLEPWIHPLRSQSPKVQPVQTSEHPPPRFNELCRYWLRGICFRGYSCHYRHGDLDYDPPPNPPPPPLATATTVPSSTPAANPPSSTVPLSTWSMSIHDYMRVKVSAGFEIQEISTGFETPWVFLEQIPATTSHDDIRQLFSGFGRTVELRIPDKTIGNFLATVKARFSTHLEAREAMTALNGSTHFGVAISAHLAVNTGGRNAAFRNTAVRINWEAPSIVGYGGYPTLQRAEAAIAETSNGPLRSSHITASIHRGLPAVSAFTVKFRNLPLDVTKEDMKRFAEPQDVMWERPNYSSLKYSIIGIQRLLENHVQVLDFDVHTGPFRDGYIRAWALFGTPDAAKSAAAFLHGRKPVCTGRTRLYAHHVSSLTFTVFADTFSKAAEDIRTFQEAVWRRPIHASVRVVPPPPSGTALVRISAEHIKDLGNLKTEFESILRGEVLRNAGAIIWDSFFLRPAGNDFIRELEKRFPGLTIFNDITRHQLTLKGPSKLRQSARQILITKVAELQSSQTRSILLTGVPIGPFIAKPFIELQRELGGENLFLDIWENKLNVRGSLADFEVALRTVHNIQKQQSRRPLRNAAACPVCFDDATVPVTLRCGHSYCRTCMTGYLVSATDTRFFPLTCLGNEAKCKQSIPLSIAREVLETSQFNSIVKATFSAYVDSHPKEFRYCPTPDCLQVYRTAPAGTVLQCPSCLVRICPECQVEYHDGFPCPDRDGGDTLFKEWAKKNNVKNCPGCKIPIERAEGCNHITCTRCQTHICWECLETFPGGEGIYGHMRVAHGGFGLGPMF